MKRKQKQQAKEKVARWANIVDKLKHTKKFKVAKARQAARSKVPKRLPD